MYKSDFYPLLKRMRRGLLISVAVYSLLLITTMTAWASVNKIADAAGILDQNQVRSAGASLRYPVDIYTTQNFSGTSIQFEQRARNHVTNANMIVMAISTNPGHMTVVAGSGVPLSTSKANSVISSFTNAYQSGGHNFTSATVSALQTLQNVVSTGPVGSGSRGTNPAPASGNGLSGLWCLVGLVVLGAIAFFVIKGRRGGGMPFGRRTYNDPTYNQPYQGNYPPNYGPGYPPQQGGMNPLAAGGLGAAAGGLLGYELGKQQGEREAREDQGYYGGDQGFSGDPNQYGGGSVGDFGGGGDGGDFGDFGGGGDSGGGSSGDF
ncbi:MAG TPA: hypothetical protein VN207_00100 [Ktedonobacteraceae bacterium]|nr:hypothetical protein [Ktedonobacteraceae bacterium]